MKGMKKKIIVLGIFCIFFTLAMTTGVSSNTVVVKNDRGSQGLLLNTNAIEYPINAPTWNRGNTWTYDMNFNFKTTGIESLSVDAEIPRMVARVEDVTTLNGENVYKLSTTGFLSGDVKFMDVVSFGSLDNVKFGGTAYIDTSSLAPKQFEFIVEGELQVLIQKWDFYFLMRMSFEPSFNFLHFPIEENENSWNLHMDRATLYAYVKFKLLGVIDQEVDYAPDAMEFDDDFVKRGIEEVNGYECVEIGGTWGNPSELYYSPEAGFLARVYEELKWSNSISAKFDLDLTSTNYIVGNDPPCQPDPISGPSEADVNELCTFNTKASDPEGDKVSYYFDWGDGFYSETGFLPSGTQGSAKHAWVKKGIYNVMVKAMDESGIESIWSEPHPVVVGYEQPSLTFIMHRIWQKDAIDVWYPWDWEAELPELYYRVRADSNGFISESSYHNTDNGAYRTDGSKWNHDADWDNIDKEHVLPVEIRNVVITIKVMDYDDKLLEGGDDLADVSGCDVPDKDGKDDDTPEKRGAIYHGTYDMGSTNPYPLKLYSPDEEDYADKWVIDEGYYNVAGDDPPDSTTDDEPPLSPQNDAEVWFSLYDNYNLPVASASVLNIPPNLRPGDSVQFTATVTDGASPFSWEWNFGDGDDSEDQNPTHSWDSPGTYTVTATITDRLGQTNTETLEIVVQENQPPTQLNIDGPSSGDAGTSHTFYFSAADPESDSLTYEIDWDDGSSKKTFSNVESGEIKTASHTWSSKGSYTITLTVTDNYGDETTEQKPFNVAKGKTFSNPLITRLISRVPILNRLVFYIIN